MDTNSFHSKGILASIFFFCVLLIQCKFNARWIPDGQLCPTVPNRSNYIHWIEDLLASDIIPANKADSDATKGFDIGTGANCIYPLLGASVLGWKFVGSGSCLFFLFCLSVLHLVLIPFSFVFVRHD